MTESKQFGEKTFYQVTEFLRKELEDDEVYGSPISKKCKFYYRINFKGGT